MAYLYLGFICLICQRDDIPYLLNNFHQDTLAPQPCSCGFQLDAAIHTSLARYMGRKATTP